ncbi:hypothetical protein NG895_09495 [Aeoliella sp. ICT_H6.2]|uniref:Uncharacterized protein n=1 Tax=Aeoliella straminimaris TaxID=2954799 RepID=A0A9X2JFX2_9BACT|nr:hypothetical protein [Aeoliella straminimaris]MCO6044141.1 hypothetical protein [Aeoliella straminimaris]
MADLDPAAIEALVALHELLLDLHQKFCFPAMEHLQEVEDHRVKSTPIPSPEACDDYRREVVDAWRKCSNAMMGIQRRIRAEPTAVDVLRGVNDDLRHFETEALPKLQEWMFESSRVALGESIKRSHTRVWQYLKDYGEDHLRAYCDAHGGVWGPEWIDQQRERLIKAQMVDKAPADTMSYSEFWAALCEMEGDDAKKVHHVLTKTEKHPNSPSGNLSFIEWVGSEIRDQAEAVGNYSRESITHHLPSIRREEAVYRLVRLSQSLGLPSSLVSDVDAALRRELTVDTVQQVHELLAPALRQLREGYEERQRPTAARAPVDAVRTEEIEAPSTTPAVPLTVEQLEIDTPKLDTRSDAWIRATDRRMRKEATVESLKAMRNALTNGAMKTEDGLFGVDKSGRYWRKDNATSTAVYYWAETLKGQSLKTEDSEKG